jgi:uncharacterized protein YdhG (YjbR/CyaY superfamily)
MQSTAATVDEYLAELPDDRRAAIEALRALIKEVAPEAVEAMRYGMAGYEMDGDILASVGSQKRYLALYVCDAGAVEAHREHLGKLDCGKGCIRFRKLADLPLGVIADILRSAADRRRAGTR